MAKWQKIALAISGSLLLGWAAFAHGAVSQCFQGGTGIGSATSGQVGYTLQISTTSPFCGYSLAAPVSGGSSTTVINGVQGPTFTFSIVSTSSASSFTTSSANIFLNLLKYSSSSDITITSTGTLVFASHNISQFTNDSGYATTTIQSVLNKLSATAPITFSTSTGVVACGTCLTANQTITLTGPVTGSGATSIATTITSPITVNVSTTQVTSTNFTAPNIAGGSFLATDSNHNIVSTSTPASGGSSVGLDGYVQYASTTAGSFAASSSFTFTTSSQLLQLKSPSGTVNIGIPPTQEINYITFNSTSTTSTFQSPAATTTLTFQVFGAQGNNTGGLGEEMIGKIVAAPNTSFTISNGTTLGRNGGGSPTTSFSGGGYTLIASSNSFSTSTAYIIAAGGGGTSNQNAAGGGGNSPTGDSGATGGACGGGTGGTQTAGGTAGSCSTPGNNGSFGQGAASVTSAGTTSGAGGGGLFGGGSGGVNGSASAGGGGGGSGFFGSTVTATSSIDAENTGNGYVIISYNTAENESDYALYVQNHIIEGGPAPSVINCGAGATVTGEDQGGFISIGSGLITSCTLVFGQPFTNAPFPTANLNITGLPVAITTSTVTSTIFSAATTFAGDTLYYNEGAN